MRGFTALAGARAFCRAHAFLRNLRSRFYDFGRRIAAGTSLLPPAAQAWDSLTSVLLGR